MATRFATALRKGGDSLAIGTEAAREARSRLGAAQVNLCLVFASIDYDLQAVLRGIRAEIGDTAEIIGSTSCGEFTETTFATKSVAVGLLSSDEYRFRVGAAAGLKEDLAAVFTTLGEELQGFVASEGETSVVMLIDGLAGLGEEASLFAASVFGPEARIVGGAAGDELAFKETKVIANDRVLNDAVAVCVAKGPSTFFAGVQHGHQPLSEPLEVTRAEGSVLYTVNGRPAWEIWKEKTRARAKEIGIDVDRLANTSEEGSFLIRFELGLETGSGYKIRVPLSRSADGSLNFACTIPEGVRFRIMQSRQEDQIRSAHVAAERAKAALGSRKAAGALVFDCVCRSIILGESFREAVGAMKEVIGPVPLLGFETYGEICMDPTQFSGFHNTTSVIVLIPASA